MLIYEGTKEKFMADQEKGDFALILDEKVAEKLGRHSAKSEYVSWQNSLQKMYMVLNDAQIPGNSGIAIEYNIPQTSKRVDFIISGYDAKDTASAVIIELKQWSKAKAVNGSDGLVETFTGGANRLVVHPSYQAWSYSVFIKDYNASVQAEEAELYPCAYLHNYVKEEPDPLMEEQYETYLSEAPLFTQSDVYKLREFIKSCITRGDDREVLYLIDKGKIKPSRSLQDAIASMLKGNSEFTMLDDQKVAYETILHLSRQCQKDDRKRVVIVEGGPGTGKSVIAVNLLAKLTNEGQFAQYVSKNSAPRNVYLKKLKGQIRKSSVDNMFKGPGIYVDTAENAVNTILCDEAHRLNEKSGLFHNLGENQIKEIIHAGLCSVFFIDESQRVTISDIGSKDEIRHWAEEAGAKVIELELTSQFRCNGSDGYLAWLDHVLEIRDTANYDLAEIDYDIRVMDSPREVYDLIKAKNGSGKSARMLAGYCWKWISEGKNDTDVHDIKIGDFEMSWNLGSTQTWAIDETSINEIGCIHTAQGLEFDYCGVIIGDDMRYEDGHIVTDFTKRASTDQSVKGLKKQYKENPEGTLKLADEIIKNTYRTLMTRGMKGCYIYCTDRNLSDYLKKMIGKGN